MKKRKKKMKQNGSNGEKTLVDMTWVTLIMHNKFGQYFYRSKGKTEIYKRLII